MHTLMELTSNLDVDGCEDKYCSIILKNLSESSPNQQKVAVVEGAIKLLLSLATSRNRDAALAALLAIYNFSTNRDCRGPMVEDQVLPGLNNLLQDTMRDNQPDFKKISLILACFKSFTMTSKLRKQLVQLHVVAACRNVVSRWRVDTTAPLPLSDWELGRAILRLAANLSWQEDAHPIMLSEGVVEAMLGAMTCLRMDPGAQVDLATAACNLTATAQGAKQVARANMIVMLEQILQAREEVLLAEEKSNARYRTTGPGARRRSSLLLTKKRPSEPVVFQKDFGVCEEDIALALRNISCYKEAAIQVARLTQTVPLMDKLVKLRSPCSHVVVSHVANAMLTFFRDEDCEKEMNLKGASGVVLHISQLDYLEPATSQLCALALSHQRHRLSR